MNKYTNYLYSKVSSDDTNVLILDDETLCSKESYCDKFLNLFPELSYSQRLTGFGVCMIMGSIFFILSFIYIPVLILKTRKFALLFTLGSICVLASFFFINGPSNHFKSLLHKDRALFTITYLTTLFTTLYTSLYLKSTFLTLIVSFAQLASLVCYLLSIIPGGATGLRYLSKVFYKTAESSLPI